MYVRLLDVYVACCAAHCKLPSRWREFGFALHQIQSAIEPHLSLRQTLLTWNEIARALAEPPRCRLPQCFDPRFARVGT
jgi:hypothetical protein